MKVLFLVIGLTICFSAHAQTHVYAAKVDGTEDKNNYIYFFNDLVFKCENCTIVFKDETSFEKHIRVMITDNTIMIVDGKSNNNIMDSVTKVGFLLKNKKIVLGTGELQKDGKMKYSDKISSAEKQKHRI